MKFSEKHDVIMKQFAGAVSMIVNPKKNQKNSDPRINKNYADLNAVKAAVIHSLEYHQLTVLQEPSYRDGQARDVLLMETTIMHTESQQWMTSLCQVPMQKTDPQGFGSTLSYARRYALMAIFSLNTADDDGNRAVKSQEAWTRDIEKAESQEDIKAILKAIQETGDAGLLKVMQNVATKRRAELEVAQSQPFSGPQSKRPKLTKQSDQDNQPSEESDF